MTKSLESEVTLDQLLDFLEGSGEIDGHWFGDQPKDGRGMFWWRKHLRPLIRHEQEEAEKAYGGCHNCYGKGYATTIEYVTSFADFIGDKTSKTPAPRMRFCDCERGQQLKAELSNKEDK